MSDYETPDLDEEEDEEEPEGWQEYWFTCGGVSEQAQQAIESVDGKVLRMTAHMSYSRKLQETRINTYYPGVPPIYAVCLLYADNDDDQGFSYHTDDGEKARQLFIASTEAHHDLYIYCEDGSTPRFESDTTQLRIVTEAEWFAIADERKSHE